MRLRSGVHQDLMREASKPVTSEAEVRLLEEELGAYRDALVAAFGIYTANPRATLLQIAKQWEEDQEALLALTGHRCVICQAPATREIADHDTYFCDEHGYDGLPLAIKEVLETCGVTAEVQLQDIAFAGSVRRALDRITPMFGVSN